MVSEAWQHSGEIGKTGRRGRTTSLAMGQLPRQVGLCANLPQEVATDSERRLDWVIPSAKNPGAETKRRFC